LQLRRVMPPRYRKILVPVDFSAASCAALEHALLLAGRLDASIEVLHVWQTPDMPPSTLRIAPQGIERGIGAYARAAAERALSEFCAPYADEDVPFRAELVFGQPVPVIRARAEEGGHDLLVMGTQGRGGLPRLLLGSVAEELVRSAPCPVLTVRAPPEAVRAASGA